MKNIQIVDDFDENVSLAVIDVLFIEQVDEHGTFYSKSVIEDAKSTLAFKPINMLWNGSDFEGHAYDSFDERRRQCIGTTIITEQYQPHYIEKNDKTYLRCYALIWKQYYQYAIDRMVQNDNEISSTSVSMEVSIYKKHEDNGVIHIDKFVFDAITVLGRNVQPAIDGADIKVLRYSSNENIIEKTKEYVEKNMYSKKNGDDFVEYEKKEKEHADETVEDKKESLEEESSNKSEQEQEDNDKKEDKEYQALQQEYSDLQEKYSKLETELLDMKEKYSVLESDNEVKKEEYSKLEKEFNSTVEKYTTLNDSYQIQLKELRELQQYKCEAEKVKLTNDADNFFVKYEKYISEDERKLLYSKLEEMGLESFKKDVSLMVLPRMEQTQKVVTQKQSYSFPLTEKIVEDKKSESIVDDTYGFKKFIKNLND